MFKKLFNKRSSASTAIPPLRREILFDSPTLRVTFIPSSNILAERLAFTFSPRVIPSVEQLEGRGFLGRRLLPYCHLIVLQSKQNLWFQDVTYAVFRAIDDYLRQHQLHKSHRFGFGASMGGFGAIQMSAALKLNAVLAFSPQFAIDEPFDRRWEKEAAAIRFVRRIDASSIGAQCRYWVVYDPKNADIRHVMRLRSLTSTAQMTEICLPHAGHTTPLVLREMGGLDSLIESFLDNKLAPTAELRKRRGESSIYLTGIAYAAVARKHNAAALRLIDRALALAPEAAETHFHRSILLSKIGADPDGLIAAARKAHSLVPGDIRYCMNLSRVLHKAGLMEEALSVTEQWLELEPNQAEAYRVLSMLYAALGKLDEAIKASASAMVLAADNAALVFNHAKLLMAASRLEEALGSIDQAIALNGAYPWYYRQRSIILSLLRRMPEALSAAEDAARLAPAEDKIIQHLEQLKKRLGEPSSRGSR